MDDPSLLDSFDDLDFFGNLGLLADGPTFLDKLDSKDGRSPGLFTLSACSGPTGDASDSEGEDFSAPKYSGRQAVAGCCMHADHEQPCCDCIDAPSAEELDLYELCGDKGKKNGAKLLRSLLKKSPQWMSSEKRLEAAREAGRAGLGRLVSALTDGHVAKLRKEEIFFIAHHWGLRSSIWRRRATGAVKISISEPIPVATGIKRGSLYRQRSNDSNTSTATALLEELDEPELPLKRQALAPQERNNDKMSMTGSMDRPSSQAVHSQPEVRAQVMPALLKLIEETGDVIMARPTRELCFALNGSGITEAKELRETHQKIGSASCAVAPLKSASEVRLLRLKSCEEDHKASEHSFRMPEEILADDLVFEVVMRTALAQKQRDVAALQANLNARSGLNALDLLDRVALSSWVKSIEIFGTIVATLETARKSNSAITYLEVSILLQDAIRKYRQVYEAASLYQITWAEEVLRHAQAHAQPAASGDAVAPGAAEGAFPLEGLYAMLEEMKQVIASSAP